jgi:outer membrane autotransporter protein
VADQTGGSGGFGGGGAAGGIAGSGGGLNVSGGGTLGGQGGTGAGAGGGGGAALGGAIFVRDGGTLTFSGGNLAGTYTVTGGNGGGGGATAGQAQGSTMYLNGSGITTFDVASGDTRTLAGSGALAGDGGLGKSGAGTLALTGSNTGYTGNVSVTGGTVAFSAADSLGSTGIITLDGGGLQWATGNTTDISSRLAALGAGGGTFDTNGNTVTFASTVSGGALTKTGAGTLILNGSNTYTGGTTISGGTLAVSSVSSFGTGTLTFDGGALSLAFSDFVNNPIVLGAGGGTFDTSTSSGFISGNITGPGSLTKTGSLFLEFTSATSYSGNTLVSEGTLLTVTQNLFSPNSAFTVSSGAVLGVVGAQTIGSLAGDGNVDGFALSGFTSNLTAGGTGASTVFNGVIGDGTGGGTLALTKAGTGIMTLGGANTYTGATTINAGTLALAGTGAIAQSSGVDLAASGAIFDISQTTAGASVAALGSTGGAGIVALGGQTLTITTTGGTFSGVIQDAGIGAGTGGGLTIGNGSVGITQTLTGANTYTGTTTINAGSALRLSGGGSIASSAVGFNAANASLDISGSTLGSSVRGLTSAGAGFGTVSLGANPLTVTGTGGSFSGVIQDGGALVIGDGVSAASQTLGGANTYTGATTISANGTLLLSGTGSVAASSGVNLSGTGATFDISGTASGAAVQDLSGVAGTTINLGNQALTAGTGNDKTFDGTIQGTGGSLTKTGSGTLTLSGNNGYTGGTRLQQGTLAVGSNTALGSGTLTLSGGSTLQAATSVSLANAITTNATATIDTGANDMTLSGPISGPGGLIKAGSGTLTLSGNSNYLGTTIIGLGTLVVNGSITGSVAVTGLTTLRGSGTIGGSVSVAGFGAPATVAPGNSIGTLTIGGNYSQDFSSTYQVEVNGSGQSDKIVVAGAATLAGTLAVRAQLGRYQRTTTYTILTAAGGVSGNFATLTSSNGALTPSVVVAGTTVTLTLLNSAAILPGSDTGGFTPNQQTIADVLNQAGPTATGDLNTVLNGLSNLSPSQLATLLNTLGGQSYAGFSSLLVQATQLFMNGFSANGGSGAVSGNGSHLPGGSTRQALRVDGGDSCDTACEVEPLWGAWGGGTGAFGTVAGNSNANGFTYNLGGFIAGLDRKLAPGFRAGLAAGFNAASLYPQGVPGNGTSNTLQFALYGTFSEAAFYLDALAGYGHSDNRMNRPIIIPGLNQRTAQGYTTANTFFGQLEAGYKILDAPSFGGFVTPFARLQASTSTQNGFTESGADSLNLTVAAQTTNSLRTVLGAQLGAAIDAPWHEKLNVNMRLGWSHEFADQTRPVTAAFVGAPAIGFTTFGATAPRDGVVLGLGANTNIAERTSLYLRYDGDLAGANTNHVLNAGVRFIW